MEHLKASTIVMLILMIGGVSANATFEIKDSCGDREENLFSMYNKSGGNIAEPGYYDLQVCASGVEDTGFSPSCTGKMESILSLNKKNDSHASTYESYRYQVCATFSAEINNSCKAGNIIASLDKRDNSHVAEPGESQYQLCADVKDVENVTLEMEMEAEDVYVDGEPAEERKYTDSELSHPYIVSGKPEGIVSYGDTISIEYIQNGSTDIFRVKEQDSGSFLVPNTKGGYAEIEDEQEEVASRQFLELYSPSFAFPIPEDPIVRVIYDPATSLYGFEREMRNNIKLFIRNRVDDNAEPDIKLTPN